MHVLTNLSQMFMHSEKNNFIYGSYKNNKYKIDVISVNSSNKCTSIAINSFRRFSGREKYHALSKTSWSS